MKKKSLQSNPPSPEVYKREGILLEWLKAVTTFYRCYHQLVTRINGEVAAQSLAITYVGQCPVSQLTRLVIDMQKQLEKLVQDIDQPVASKQSVSTEGCRKLLSHIGMLNQLSQEARRALHLANGAAS